MQIQIANERERLVAEQALLMYREVEAAGAAAAYGQGMAALEDATLEAGRRQMRLVLEQALESRAKAFKKKGALCVLRAIGPVQAGQFQDTDQRGG